LPPKPIAVVTTVGTLTAARAIAGAMVERGLAACAQICVIESFYRWKGRMQNEPEYRILLKTTAARYPAIEAAIAGLHPYDLPAIHAQALEQVYAPYAQWIEEHSTGEPT
jgi:periplasmic divalent cation tolerance protein